MNTLLQILLGSLFSTHCPQPAGIRNFEVRGLPAESAEICFAHRPKPFPQLRII